MNTISKNNLGNVPLFIILILLLVPFSLAQAAPTWQASSAIAASTGTDVTVTLPTHAANDILLLQVVVRDINDTISWPAGWAQIASVDSTTARYWWAWKRAASSAETNPLVDKNTTTGGTYAAVTTYRGAIATGDPWDVIGTPNTATTVAHTLNGITTTSANTLIIAALCGESNAAASGTTFSASNPAALTQVFYDEWASGAEKGACTVGADAKVAIGATGNITATWTKDVTGSGGIVLALKPAAAGAASQLAFAQQPSNTMAGSVITPAITVQIQDASGNLVTTATDTVTIAFGTDPSSGVALLSGTLSVAAVAVAGVATFSTLDIDTGGSGYTLAASVAGLTGATSSAFNITTPSGTFGATQCAASRFGSDLVCTAGDVSITGIAIVPGGPTSCIGGSSVTIDLDVTVNFAVPTRWDAGIFLATDGKNPEKLPANGGATSCTVAVLPTTSPFLNADPLGSGGITDTCGDGNKDINGGTGTGVVRVTNVPVSCQAVDLSGGRLFIPFLTSWDNQSSPSGSTCTSNLNPVPNTKSKCNVPNGTVLADVLKSTVALVILPTITKSDLLTTITAGDSTTYTVVITNTTGAPLSNAIFRDPAVANLTVNNLSCSAAGGASCPATYTIANMQGGGITLPSMPVNSSVTFTINATVSSSTPVGTLTNTASVTVSAESNSAADINNVIAKLAASKSFVPASIAIGGTSVLSITLQNTNLTEATGVAFTDTYPANLFNTASPVTNTCGGTATAAAGGSSLALSGGTISAGSSCTVTVAVSSAVGGAYTNSTGNITSNEYSGDPAFASLAVAASSLANSSKSWQDLNGGEADPGDTIRYTITLTETAGYNATGVSVADTIDSDLTVVSCSPPAGATCNFSGQPLTVTGITVPASSSVTIVFDATINPATSPGASINNCAPISNPGGVEASLCASTITVSPSAVAGAGNKKLYLFDSTTISRSMPSGTPATVSISRSGSQLWALNPVLAMPVTISPDVTPLAIIPVNLYLTSNTASESRTVQVDVTCSGGGTTYSETKIFDGTAVNNPYLSTSTPTLVSFNNLTISTNHTCAAGQTWNLTVRNNTTGSGIKNVIVHPVSSGNNSYISLPSLTIINVDSVNNYDAAYAAVTTPVSGYFGGGQTVYIRAIVSDPFGSFDITSATVTIKNPYGTTVVADAAMPMVADSGSATKIFEYPYTIPTSGPAGIWTTIVTAQEGTEGTISDDGTGVFNLGLPSLLVVKSAQTYSDPVNGIGAGAKAIPGAFVTYTIQVVNSGHGAVDNNTTVITDPIPANTELFVGDINGAGSGPILFTDGVTGVGTAPSGLSYTFTSLASITDNLEFSGTVVPPYIYDKIPPPLIEFDPTVTSIKIPLSGTFNSSDGTNHPTFNVKFRVRIK